MMIKTLLALACLMASTLAPSSFSSKAPDYDLIITNGTVIDGSGNPRFSADVGIRGDRIAKIGSLKGATAGHTRDAGGQIVAPGFIDIGMSKALPDEVTQNFIKQIPLGRLGNVNEIVDAALFLASPMASYITGHVLNVNGGFYMG